MILWWLLAANLSSSNRQKTLARSTGEETVLPDLFDSVFLSGDSGEQIGLKYIIMSRISFSGMACVVRWHSFLVTAIWRWKDESPGYFGLTRKINSVTS
jgi:hypothetical protein